MPLKEHIQDLVSNHLKKGFKERVSMVIMKLKSMDFIHCKVIIWASSITEIWT